MAIKIKQEEKIPRVKRAVAEVPEEQKKTNGGRILKPKTKCDCNQQQQKTSKK
jgi:hypothetical protein